LRRDCKTHDEHTNAGDLKGLAAASASDRLQNRGVLPAGLRGDAGKQRYTHQQRAEYSNPGSSSIGPFHGGLIAASISRAKRLQNLKMEAKRAKNSEVREESGVLARHSGQRDRLRSPLQQEYHQFASM
jgi:hypothetical protein